MKMARAHYFVLTLALAFCTSISSAQVSTGTPPFGSFGGGPDIINLANLNSHWDVPVFTKAGRGGFNFTYDLTYDSSVWYPTIVNGTNTWQPAGNFGWAGQTQVVTGYVGSAASYSQTQQYCGPDQGYMTIGTWTYSGWVYYDAFGVPHSYKSSSSTTTYSGCGNNNSTSTGFTETTADGSGYTLDVNGGCAPCSVVSVAGKGLITPYNSSNGIGTATDRNGNQINVDSSGHFTDTLGATALTVAGSAPNPVTFTYTAPSASAHYTMSYATRTVKTNFGCSGIAEYGPTSNSLVDRITLPDGSFYQFNYEPTPGFSGDYTGRLVSVTLPTGGTISYSYSGGSNGISCADGSAATLTRTTPDGIWTYSQVKGSGAASTTTVTDPQSNVTTIQFQGIYETQRQVSGLLTYDCVNSDLKSSSVSST
jgi:hypothetical protein